MPRCRSYDRPTPEQILDFESDVLATLKLGTLTTKELAEEFGLETNVCLMRLHKMLKKQLIGVKRDQRNGNQWFIVRHTAPAEVSDQSPKLSKFTAANDSNSPKTRLIPGLINWSNQ
jgi:hypothetical protein